ncbi:RHS repeat domain-containing protein [Dysgonomonas macrotermitis]|uniref:RHS repeat-associated core domain-containing protein n=1 Tax=Dysgonomonas macrotermitis TaxID=1346286 RepID=A0A1M4YCB5_9BACT|nr:RHS repeat-associated core domain-containing protein [Dysgonomonas macrotermitis]SHF03444.1 RHS repeat-associated core domain-containing protein [Dysgonomonas macrotermitis]
MTTKYTYNVRSWTNTITNTHFSQTLTYNLNGNIGTQQWTQNGKTRKYAFTYDNISRLKAANYTGDGNFSTGYSYDAHGNVIKLTRYGITASGVSDQIIDNLTFNYDGTGNQLKYIADAGPNVGLSTIADFKEFSEVTTSEFTYNKNGAIHIDLNKGQTVNYNSLNLPQEMLINNTSARGKTYYTYTATGAKLRVKHLSDPTLMVTPVKGTAEDASYRVQTSTDYAGNKIYENETLSKILTDNGYIEDSNYYFYIKDHLGNNRIVANAAGTVVQRNSFYPFGMTYGEESDLEQGKQPYKYNGKELDKMHGLNWYDYEARYMDPATIRFTSVDPMAEKYYSWSPYAYVGNNPMRFIDPTGMIWDDPNVAYKLKNKIDKKIESLKKDIADNQASLNKGGHSAKKIAKLEDKISDAKSRISNLNVSKGDIDKLGADQNNIYALSSISGGEHKVRQGSDGKIYIETSSDALSIHEIAHVRQSLDAGGLKFSPNGELKNSGIGIKGISNMEIEAYQKQYSLDESFPGRLNGRAIQGIDVHSVGNITDDKGRRVYEIIYQYSEAIKKAIKVNQKK